MTESGLLPEQSLYQVSIEGTGLVFDINENDTVLSGILRAGTGIPYECNAGGCGSCKYTLIEGEVVDDLNESPGLRASDRRRNKHLACISHPRSHCKIQIKPDSDYVPKHPPQQIQATLQSIEKLTRDLWEFRFDTSQAAHFLPGQYAKVSIPGVTGPRSYSMCNTANDTGQWAFQIKRVEGGSASSVLFADALKEIRVTIDAPYSIAHLKTDSPRPIICIAGGSGLAPMISILQGVSEIHGYTHKPVLFYGAQTVDDLVSREYLDTIPGFGSDQQYIPIISNSKSGLDWKGATGLVHEYLAETLSDNCKDFDYYIAGPPPMVDAVRRHLILDRGIPVEQLHYDRFY